MKINIKTFLAAFIVILLMGTVTASAFMVDLTVPNESGMPVMTYAKVRGTVDAADNSIFHFDIDFAPGLKGNLNGGLNFGIDKFFFNTTLDRIHLMFKNFDPMLLSISEDRQAGGFGKFDIRLNRLKRTDHLYFDIDSTSALTEDDFFGGNPAYINEV